MTHPTRAAVALACLLAAPAAAETVKIGLVTTLSGPEAVMGNPMRDSAELALAMLGGKIGGQPAEIIYGDDQQKPDAGRQIIEKMLQKNKVTFITGMLGANVLMAVYPQIIHSRTILISSNTGPHQIAGAQCSRYFFSTAQQTDEPAEAMGKYLTDNHIDDVYVMAPNYNSGKDMITGFKRYFTGTIVGGVYTPFGQLDYQAEISAIRAAHPKAVFVFYPGGMGIQFVKQYAQAGLKEQIPLYSVFAVDEVTLPAEQDAALGDYSAQYWSAALQNPRNRMYVDAFVAKFGYPPSSYGASTFDAIFLMDSAVRAVHGDLNDKAGMIAAMEKSDFPSVRGNVTFNSNHFPIENFYVFQAARDQDGKIAMHQVQTVFTDHKDSYYSECNMNND